VDIPAVINAGMMRLQKMIQEAGNVQVKMESGMIT
jgi:hypothetical protein